MMKREKIVLMMQVLFFLWNIKAAYGQSNEQNERKESGGGGIGQELQNPIANIISIPFQNNFEYKIGTNRGSRYILNFQPVIPVSLTKDVNLITRFILPLVSQDNIVTEPERTQTGLSDALISFFLSPKEGNLIWGAGPVLQVPTATEKIFGTEKWSTGPTAVVLKQTGPWTVGMLANHLWSVEGDDSRSSVSSSYFQPFLSHTNEKQFTVGLSGEYSYNWMIDKLNGVLLFNVSQVTLAGNQPISLGLSAKYFYAGPEPLPSWGGRATVTFIIPKGKG